MTPQLPPHLAVMPPLPTLQQLPIDGSQGPQLQRPLTPQPQRGASDDEFAQPLPRTRSDDALRASIGERFHGAYEAQIGHLARVAAEEQKVLQSDIGVLRNLAYVAQRNAVEQRLRTDAARRALGASAQESWGLREAIGIVHAELAAEAAALTHSRALVQREELASAELHAQAEAEIAELVAKCEAAQRRRRAEDELAAELERALEVARSERIAETEVATESRMRAEAAEAASQRALHGLRNHEEHATKTLKEAVAALEADFTRERADFRERDRRTLSRIQELEWELDQRRYAAIQPRSFGSSS